MFEFMFLFLLHKQTRGLSDSIVSAPRLVIARVRPEFDDALDDFLRQKRELRLEHASELRKVKAFVVREATGCDHVLNVRLIEVRSLSHGFHKLSPREFRARTEKSWVNVATSISVPGVQRCGINYHFQCRTTAVQLPIPKVHVSPCIEEQLQAGVHPTSCLG